MTKGELRAAISRGYREMSELTKVKCGGDKCQAWATEPIAVVTECIMEMHYGDDD